MNDEVTLISPDRNTDVVVHNEPQIDIFFQMYEKINAKNEEIEKSYKNNLRIKFEDIKELHYKTIQSIKSLSPEKGDIGVRIIVSHNEGESNKFNSFLEFEKHNTTSPNPTLNIIMRYTFALYNLNESKFEIFKITNLVISRIAQLEQLEKDAPSFFPKMLLSGIASKTAQITVEYEDYVKARHFTAMFDEWIKGCDETKNASIIELSKKYSHLIPRLGKLLIFSLLAFFTAAAIDSSFIVSELSVKFVVFYASIFVIVGSLSGIFLRKVEMAIDSYLAVSYLKLNKGDQKLIEKYSGRNRESFYWALAGTSATICLGVFTNFVYDFIKLFIT